MKEGKKVKKAREFAIKAHEGQKRKFTFAPYIVHPASVAQKVLMSPYADENMVCAAWLHDIVEDCAGYTIGTIRREFGKDVANLVDELTNRSVLSDGSRSIRSKIDREKTRLTSPRAKTIRIADILDNAETWKTVKSPFAEIWMMEKVDMLPALSDANDPEMYAEFFELCNSYCKKRLGILDFPMA